MYAQEEQKAARRKIVLQLPDLDQAKPAMLNKFEFTRDRDETTNFRWRNSPRGNASESRACSESRRSHQVSSLPGIEWIGSRHDQSAARCSEAACLRRLPISGLLISNSPQGIRGVKGVK